MKKYTRVLTIAGSDSGGGAGIQADLKAFSACGCYGMSAVTAITAQNTVGVTDIHPIPVVTIQAQIRAVIGDIGVDAVKIGMLHSTEVIRGVAEVLNTHDIRKVVLDPVMVATSGDRLIERDAVSSLKEDLFPQVYVITPNIPEAELLLDTKIESRQAFEEAAYELSRNHNVSVLLKAGHFSGKTLEDILVLAGDGGVHRYANSRIATTNTHGTGCTLSSALASYIGKGYDLPEAVGLAEKYLHKAIEAGAAFELGKGHGPVHHFHEYWPKEK
ncbi:bifunctional hydroxymethylpyrimidine kinase/phosphomethylpyrimidine kinase [Desulfopila sp. IMCC35008]|uniref:bifunctional hydroxymethylpyrimidine kinase/phosphomethylpyrimidine kinase n=1 Tax=Desulfopila sp. IMCC35008 TaxID=2653858 RepID=UPI0013D8515C|nr:bifunctional hydroxymethylpyrimidine kinase/phosphomethylpyrimidine kinase [Desulfopila sp. IMCC35008]